MDISNKDFNTTGDSEYFIGIFKSALKSIDSDIELIPMNADVPQGKPVLYYCAKLNDTEYNFILSATRTRRSTESHPNELGVQISYAQSYKNINSNYNFIGVVVSELTSGGKIVFSFFNIADNEWGSDTSITKSNSLQVNVLKDVNPALNKGISIRDSKNKFPVISCNSDLIDTALKIYKYLSNSILKKTIDNISYSNKIFISNQFLLLAGISGTGKSRFVREQAKMWGDAYPDNFELVSVRPDWHEPSDLLGYITRLSGNPDFISTALLKFIVKAWQKIDPAPNQFEENKFDFKTDLSPYWLCLDEMNLSPVEQYFSDYLSVLETRKIENGIYRCEPLLKKDVFEELLNSYDDNVSSGQKSPREQAKAKLADTLGLTPDNQLFGSFLMYGIPLPYNLIVAGTVNMDETTHIFSRKVIDRALTLDFGEFYPNEAIYGNDFKTFFSPQVTDKKLSYPIATSPSNTFSKIENHDSGLLSYEFFSDVNKILKGTMFELAYRALNELLLEVQSFNPQSKEDICAVWDDFLMMKVLPRIEGDEDKLAFYEKNEKGDWVSKHNILKELKELLSGKNKVPFKSTDVVNDDHTQEIIQERLAIESELLNFKGTAVTTLQPIWDGKNRPDLLRDNAGNIECRSKKKIELMQRKLHGGFTSFWP
jgi:hypothetical protein